MALQRRLAVVTTRFGKALEDWMFVVRRALGDEAEALLERVDVVAIKGEANKVDGWASALQSSARGYAAVAIIRGGGQDNHLAIFDSPEIHEAIRLLQSQNVRVFTGIGHAQDTLALDKIVFRASTTPTQCAYDVIEFLADEGWQHGDIDLPEPCPSLLELDGEPHPYAQRKPAQAATVKLDLALPVRTPAPEQFTEAPSPAPVLKAIQDALKGRPGVTDFAARLRDSGVILVPCVSATGVITGMSFLYQGYRMWGSSLGREYGWKGLSARLDYVSERDDVVLAKMLERLEDKGIVALQDKPYLDRQKEANRQRIVDTIAGLVRAELVRTREDVLDVLRQGGLTISRVEVNEITIQTRAGDKYVLTGGMFAQSFGAALSDAVASFAALNEYDEMLPADEYRRRVYERKRAAA